MKLKRIYLGLILASATTAMAEHHQHSAHEHGAANMFVALEGEELQIALDSPAANLIGFEYKPESESDWKAVEKMHKVFTNPKKLFKFNKGADCEFEELSIEPEFLAVKDNHDEHDHDEHKHDEHDHDEHKHDEHDHEEHKHDEHDHDEHKHDEHDHDEHKHDEHKHDEHDHHDHEESGHMDIQAQWNFHCHGKVESIEMKIFKAFPATEELEVVYLTESGQGGAELTKSKNKLTIK